MLADNHGNASSCGRQAQLARRRLPAGSQCCHRPQGPPPGASRDTEAQRHLSPTLGCLLGMEIAPCLYQHEGPHSKVGVGGWAMGGRAETLPAWPGAIWEGFLKEVSISQAFLVMVVATSAHTYSTIDLISAFH